MAKLITFNEAARKSLRRSWASLTHTQIIVSFEP
mgnify:CR=1 FL=1